MFPMLKKIAPMVFVLSILFLGCASDQKKAENFLTEADTYFQKKEFDKALIQIKNCIKLEPKSIAAHALMAKTHLKLKDAQNAYKTYLRLEQLDPDNLDTKLELAGFNLLGKNFPEAEKRVDFILAKQPDHIRALYLNTGLLGRDSENLNKITGIYKRILEIDPAQTNAHFALARIYMDQNQKDLAEEHLSDARKLAPENLNIYRALYGLYLSKGEPDKAETLLKQLVTDMPDKSDVLVLLGNHYIARGKTQEAVATLNKAIEIDPATIKPQIVLARFFNAKGAPDKAEEYIQKAVAIDPDNQELKLLHADFNFIHKNIPQAERLVDEILAERPGHVPSKALKGKILIQKKKFDAAIALFQELVRDEPNSAPYNFFLGNALIQDRRPKEGLIYISKTLDLNPNHMLARMIMADSHFRNRDYFLAQTQVQNVLAKMPDNYNANILLGNIHAARKELGKARTVYERMIGLAPDNPSAYYRLGLVSRMENKLDKAMAHFTKALELNSMLMDVFSQIIGIKAQNKNYKKTIQFCDSHIQKVKDAPIAVSIILNLKANLLFAEKKMEEGKQALAQSIEKNSTYITPYLTLAGIHNSQGNSAQAIGLYKDLIKNRPDQASPHSLLGTLYEKQTNFDLAETHYKQALEINPDFIPALNNLAFLYAEQNKNLNKALELAQQAREKTGAITAIMDTLGWVYYKKGLYPSAVQEFTACIEKEPANPIFHYHLGLAYNKLWKYDQAKTSLAKALELQPDFNGSDEAKKILAQL